jgi:hypothetical protein
VRNALLVLTIAACAAWLPSQAQQHEPAPARTPPVVAATDDEAGDEGMAEGISGFGQIMSVLTGLLQDAASKASAGASASQTLSSEESAVTIRVTPVAGRSTFFVAKPRSESATSAAQAEGPTADAPRADAARVALQAEGALPD